MIPTILKREDLPEIPLKKQEGIPLREIFHILRKRGIAKYFRAGRTSGHSVGLCLNNIETDLINLEIWCDYNEELDLPAYMTASGRLVLVVDGRIEILAKPSLCVDWRSIPLGDMTNDQVNEALARVDKYVNSPEGDAMLRSLGKEMAQIEREYESLDRLDLKTARTPMNC